MSNIVDVEVLPAANVPQPFDYSGWEPELADTARTAAAMIRRHMERSMASMVEAGECLRAIKSQLPYGDWQEWLAAEFVMSDRMARHLMQVAEAFSGQTEIVSVLSPTAALKLAAAPEAARAVVVERLQSGQKMTVAEVTAAIRSHPQQSVGNHKAAAKLATWSFVSNFEAQAIGHWRESVAVLGAAVQTVADDIKRTADECVSKGRPPPKKWANEMSARLAGIEESVRQLTGVRYGRRATRAGSIAFSPTGRVDDILDVLVHLQSRCYTAAKLNNPLPEPTEMAALRDQLVAAGL